MINRVDNSSKVTSAIFFNDLENNKNTSRNKSALFNVGKIRAVEALIEQKEMLKKSLDQIKDYKEKYTLKIKSQIKDFEGILGEVNTAIDSYKSKDMDMEYEKIDVDDLDKSFKKTLNSKDKKDKDKSLDESLKEIEKLKENLDKNFKINDKKNKDYSIDVLKSIKDGLEATLKNLSSILNSFEENTNNEIKNIQNEIKKVESKISEVSKTKEGGIINIRV